MSNQESRLSIVIDSSKAEGNLKRLRESLAGLSTDSSKVADTLGKFSGSSNGFSALITATERLGKAMQNATSDSRAFSDAFRSAFSGIAPSTGAAESGLSRFENTIKELVDVFNKLETEMRGLQTGLTTLSGRINPLSSDINRLGTSANGTVNNLNSMSNSFNNVTNNTNHLNRTINNTNNVTNNLNRTINNTTNNYNRLGDVVNHNTTIINNYNDTVNNTGGILAGVTGKVLGFVAAFGGLSVVGSQIVSTQREFDVLNAQLVTATGSTEAAADQFKRLQEFAAQTPYDLGQAVGGFAQLKNLGLDPSMESMESFGNTASAMGKDLSQMIEAVADASTGEFERLKEFGIKSKSEGDKVSFTFQGVTTTVGKNAKEIQDYLIGIGKTNFAGAMQNRMDTLDGAISNLGDSYSNLLLNISSSGVGDLIAQGVRAASSALDVLPEKIEGIVGKLSTLNQQYDFSGKFAAAVDGIGFAFGNLQSVIDRTWEIMSPIVAWFKEHDEFTTSLATAIGVVAGAFVVYNAAVAIGAAVTGALAGAFALLTSPITLIVLAITGLVAASIYLYRNWDEIKAKATEIWGGIKDAVTSNIDGIKSSMSASWDNIKSTTASKAQEAVNAAKNAFNGLPAPIKTVLTVAYNIVKTQIDLMKNAFTTGLNIIKAVVRGDMQGVVNAFKTGMSNAWNIVKQGVSNILNAIKDLGAKLFRMGSDAVDGLVRGLKAKIGEVRNAASELGQAAWGGVKSFLQIRSPSRKMAELGKHTADGLAKGIKKNKKPVISEAQKMAQEAVKAVKDTIATLQRDIALFGNDDPVAAMLWDRANTDKYKGVDNGLFNQAVDLTKQKRALEEAKTLADKFKEVLKGIQDAIKGSVSTELEKWSTALYDADNELSKLEGGKKLELLTKAADLDYSNLSKEITKGNLEIDRQLELMGARTDLDKELLKISYDLTDTMAKYSYYLETGQEARYNELESLAMIRAEREKGLAILKEEQKLKDSLDSDLSGIRTELLGYGINETDSDKNDYQLADTLERLRQAHEMQLMQQDEFQKLSEIAKQRHADKMAEIENAMYQNRAGLFASASKALLGENSRMYRLLFAIEKGYALQSAWLEHKKSILKAYSETPGSVWAKAAAAAKAAADTGLMAAAIAAVQAPIGQAHDGIMSVPKSGTWNLEKGERVLPAHTAKAMDKKLEQSGGGEVNITINVDAQGNSTMDAQNANQMSRQLANTIKAVVQGELRQERRQGGLFSGA